MYIFLHGASQPVVGDSCEPIGADIRYLYLNGSNNTLIDNALRCFRLSSIGRYNESCIRIWVYENNSPDTPFLYRIKLFELGEKNGKKYACFNTLEWGIDNLDSLIVKCIKKKLVQPLNGWAYLEKNIRASKLDKIYSIPIPLHTDDEAIGIGLIMLQYFTENKTITVDFSAYSRFADSKYERIERFTQLIKYIRKEFSINLFADSNGHDLLKVIPIKKTLQRSWKYHLIINKNFTDHNIIG